MYRLVTKRVEENAHVSIFWDTENHACTGL